MIREAHERPEGMDEGVLVMSGLKSSRVLQAIAVATAQHEGGAGSFPRVRDYQADNVSRKVLYIILSYVDYINRTVWYV
jgi:UDP-N-acetylglucosamine 2-epimerase (non-hydrolysing)